MRYLLDGKHYVDDMLLEKGVVVGDHVEGQPPPAHPWRYSRENRRIGVTSGQAMPPTNYMIPLDDEAKKMYKDAFGEEPPDRDPLAPIPLMGSVRETPVPEMSSARPAPPPPKVEPITDKK